MMRYSAPNEPTPRLDVAATAEESLRRENEELRRQLEELRGLHHPSSEGRIPAQLWRPSRMTIWALCVGAAVLTILAFLGGYLPLQKRKALIVAEAHESEKALPRVEVTEVRQAPSKSTLQLPGNIQATTEAPILARADGYIKERKVDIGDRVRAGQRLAVIEAPELDEQVHQAEATLQQARAGVDQANANLRQGKSDLELARVTAKRWGNLVSDGSVSVQENDQYQAQYHSKIAAVQALEQAVVAQHNGVSAAEANLARLESMKSYRVVTAPFDGVITLRNVDVGALVNIGTTLLFRIAQTTTLRTYVSVPQTNADFVHRGDTASLTVSNLPGRVFRGTIARTANALDPASRTLLVEIHVPNGSGVLLPGMYAQVELNSSRTESPLLIPSDALIVRGDGTQVALVRQDHRIHLQKIEVGRDYGDRLEVMSGLHLGDSVIANPGDVAHEGTEVESVPIAEKAVEAAHPQNTRR